MPGIPQFPRSELADNALCKTGEISERLLSDPGTAEKLYRRLIGEYGQSGWVACTREALKKCAEGKEQKQGKRISQ